MATVFVLHRVRDYGKWRDVYDSVGEMVDRVNKSLDGLQLPAIKLGEKTLVEVFAETAEE